ncbi:MAG: type II toxin-antitoxin system HicB family antitoxin [Gammaproteobacteria bacterium]|nr:type II toxin-antitoxin system HicB family antitoxin [Gammaproteobacteria bacterium]
MYAYPVAVFKQPGSDYGTVVADLPGCCSAGSTLSEALAQTREAIYTHLEGMAKDGEVAPAPSDLSAIQASGDYACAVAFAAVEIDVSKVSAETDRVNVKLPRWLLSNIDATETNRSRFLTESAIKALQEKHRENIA